MSRHTLRFVILATLLWATSPLAAAAQAPPANEPAQPLRFERVIRDQRAGSVEAQPVGRRLRDRLPDRNVIPGHPSEAASPGRRATGLSSRDR